MAESEIFSRINKLADEVSDLKERLARTETIADRTPILEGKLDKLIDLIQMVSTKQAVLAVKVGLICSGIAILAGAIAGAIF